MSTDDVANFSVSEFKVNMKKEMQKEANLPRILSVKRIYKMEVPLKKCFLYGCTNPRRWDNSGERYFYACSVDHARELKFFPVEPTVVDGGEDSSPKQFKTYIKRY